MQGENIGIDHQVELALLEVGSIVWQESLRRTCEKSYLKGRDLVFQSLGVEDCGILEPSESKYEGSQVSGCDQLFEPQQGFLCNHCRETLIYRISVSCIITRNDVC